MNDTLVDVQDHVIQRTLRVPLPSGPSGDGAAAARQFDAALASVGFKLSAELFDRLSGYTEGVVIDTAIPVLASVRRMVGDHVQHNVYFKDFPRNVPDTVSFWVECLVEALADPVAAERVAGDTRVFGTLNLLSLPRYGQYQHSYTEMLAAHSDLIERASDRVTVLHAGESLAAEASALYLSLASATTPGNDADREALTDLALACAGDESQPDRIPVRENRALINQVRLAAGADLLVDSVTDVLRLACAVSDGDVTLVQPTRFRISKRARRAILAALNQVVERNRAALGDVHQYRERWKRLGECLHPHEFLQFPHAGDVFAVARGDIHAPSLMSRVEELAGQGDATGAAFLLLKAAPGRLLRSADWLLRSSESPEAVLSAISGAAPDVSGRVLLSLRQHLVNRDRQRVFVNRSAQGGVESDTRQPIDAGVLAKLASLLDDEVRGRLSGPRWVVDPAMDSVALPLSGKTIAGGLGTLPRGTATPIDGNLLRFFIYWREQAETTDFDLSVLLLDRDFDQPQWVSYTNLSTGGVVHSGDITSAPDGASEFIDLDLSQVKADVVIPQVNVFSGEGFEEVAESFFGFMLREREQQGQPFEPRTVRMKSELRGSGRVALPMAFVRDQGSWRAVWLHLFLAGRPSFNRVESNRGSTVDLVRAVIGQEFLTVGYFARLLGAARELPPKDSGPVTYVGLADPGGLPEGSTVITPANLGVLVPD